MSEDLDEIRLTGIRAAGRHGVYDHERRDGQEFIADITLRLSLARAAQTDDVADTVHYGIFAEQVAGILSGDPVNLIETVADRIVAAAFGDPRVAAVSVTVHKPDAPITVPFDDVSVTLHRRRPAEETS